jgi:hypothetical protein
MWRGGMRYVYLRRVFENVFELIVEEVKELVCVVWNHHVHGFVVHFEDFSKV